MIKLRRCPTCGRYKPETARHFQRDRNKPSGFRAGCKPCLNNKSRNNYFNYPFAKIASAAWWTMRNRHKVNTRKKHTRNQLLDSLRSRIRHAVRRARATKISSTIKLIGCSANQLKKHLSRQFKAGMSWSNYGRGGWEIDHRLPCSMFNLRNSTEQKKCFHYSNLQPMWQRENASKGNRI
jgi:hypothetical protein